MARSTDPLERALEFSFGAEGGYLSAARAREIGDPGGETKFGISKRSYPHLDIASLTLAQAEAIYRTDFWPAIHGQHLPALVGFVALDYAINSGPARANAAVRATAGLDPLRAAMGIQALRRAFLKWLGRKRPKTAKGWMNRMDRLDAALLAYAKELRDGPAD